MTNPDQLIVDLYLARQAAKRAKMFKWDSPKSAESHRQAVVRQAQAMRRLLAYGKMRVETAVPHA
jgi:hypothetical protein